MVFEFSKLITKYPIGRKVTVQSDGHTDRVTVAGYRFADRGWYIDTEERGIILLSRLEQMELTKVLPVMEGTVGKLLEEIRENICSRYCKYPDCFEDEEELHVAQCDSCPLKRML